MLLFRLHQIAQRLRPLRPWCLWLTAATLATVMYGLLDQRDAHPMLIRLGLVFTMWLLLTYAFIQLYQTIPAPVLPGDHITERLRGRFRLGLYHLLTITVAVVSLMLVSLSLKLLFLR